jgi:hypothetical protein
MGDIIARDGGFDGPQKVAFIARRTPRHPSQRLDSPSAGDYQAGCRLLLMFSLGDKGCHLVEGIARVQDW